MSRIYRSKGDEQEFIRIARGLIRKDLGRYISRGEIRVPRINNPGIFSIPIETIEIPKFRFGGLEDESEIGSGDGDEGDDLGPAPDKGCKEGEPGSGEGHGEGIEIDFSVDEFRTMFQEQLELPNIKPKGDKTVFVERERYSSISRKGSPSLISRHRTYKEILKRSIAFGTFMPDDPSKRALVPRGDDFRYKSTDIVMEPKNNAVCFWERDGSGSMGPAEIRVVNQLVSLCEFWLSCFYDRLDNIYLLHDDEAHEVSREDFYGKSYGGGTVCSTVLKKQAQITEERYPVNSWNIYATYLSDGLNFTSDNREFIDVVSNKIVPVVNQFNYGEIQLYRPWWDFYNPSSKRFSDPGTIGGFLDLLAGVTKNVAVAKIERDNEEAIVQAIKKFFGKGN